MPTKKAPESKKIAKKPEPSKKDSFSFGAKKMTKEERDAIIEEALKPKTSPLSLKYTIDETEYIPNKWVVVITPEGNVYQEPVPRYWDYQTFVYILASIPDKPLQTNNKIDFSSDIYKTTFEVKGVECYIITVPSTGNRKLNSYDKPFGIKNLTSSIGGNIVFAGGENGFNKKEAKLVTEKIIKLLDSYEEIINFK